MAALTADDFPAFFEALWGYPPFPWQTRLLRGVAADGAWPEVLDLPTGSGKTAAIDIAVFHLALEAAKGEARRAPLRIAFVVDRRIIVDDTYGRAKDMAGKLSAARDGDGAGSVLHKVAAALCGLSGSNEPLAVAALRGGAPREDEWARTPVQPTILCSTVDQVGSRLLFRGYGVSDSMKPIHAGLLGSDCLILLDEAHLAEPFRQTLDAVKRLRKAPQEKAPFAFATLTATPNVGAQSSFALDPEDQANPTLAARLAAPKPARLIDIAGKQGVDTEVRRVDVLVEHAKAMLESRRRHGIAQPVIGIVVNRVARARASFDRLRADLADCEVTLIVGPARPVDRDNLTKELAPIRTGKDDARRSMTKPLLVIATQTIEAGVDIDFDGLVTEAAALDALRQRFGRLDRAGRSLGAEAVILAHKDDIGPKADDPVYGDRIRSTWEKLQALAAAAGGMVDFGISALRNAIPRDEERALATRAQDAPVVMPAYADLWSQTSPIPNADPEVALFLHGRDRSPASVQIVWRADIEESDLSDSRKSDLIAVLALAPPRVREAIAVPIWAAKAWLSRSDLAPTQISDAPESHHAPGEEVRRGRAAFRWAGEDGTRTGVVRPADLADGDLIVVPSLYGGCDRWGWTPGSLESVIDVAEKAAWPFRGRSFAVRVTPALIAQQMEPGRADRAAIEQTLRAILGENEGTRPDDILDAVRDIGVLPKELRDQLSALRRDNRKPLRGVKGRIPALEAHLDLYGRQEGEAPRGVIFVAPRGLENDADDQGVEPTTESDETGAAAANAILLRDHSDHVREWARSFAEAVGAAPDICADIALSGYLHDPGKADRRWQGFVTGGNRYGPDPGEPLAKSGKPLPRGAWQRAGLPDRWRHEALSVRLARLRSEFRKTAHDPMLVLWLIGTHHGYGRPLFPHGDTLDGRDCTIGLPREFGGKTLVEARVPGPESLAFDFEGHDWAQMFETLKRKYGIWGLARLEAFVRLADHRASEAGAPPAAAPSFREAAE